MRTLVYSLVLVGALLLPGFAMAKETPASEVKSESLHYLQELRTRESKRLHDIDESLNHKMEDTPTATLDQEVKALKEQQYEHRLRQEFLDRLIFQFDTHFIGGDLRAFLEKALIEMAKVDAVSSLQPDAGLWKFLKYSAEAVKRLPEQKENILAFLEGYMNRSVANPILPQDYLATRNYTNGSGSDSGRPLSREEAGAVTDQRLQELSRAELQAAELHGTTALKAHPGAAACAGTINKVAPKDKVACENTTLNQ